MSAFPKLPSFFSPAKGRLSRRSFWTSSFLVFGILLLAALPVLLIAFLFSDEASRWPPAVSLLLSAIFALAFLAVSVHWAVTVALPRLHDRNKGWVWLIVFLVLPTFFDGMTRGTWGGAPSSGLGMAYATIGWALAIWGVVEMGLLPGTNGGNRFGSEPSK